MKLGFRNTCQRSASSFSRPSFKRDSLKFLPRAASSTDVRVTTAHIRTGSESALAVGRYLVLNYDASQGHGLGMAYHRDGKGLYDIKIDPKRLVVPALNSTTGSLRSPLGSTALPYGLTVTLTPVVFEGTLNSITGELNLVLEAAFRFKIEAPNPFSMPFQRPTAKLIESQPMRVRIPMSTGPAGGLSIPGGMRTRGKPWSLATSRFLVVGSAMIPRAGDMIMDSVLMLPTECRIELAGTLSLGDAGLELSGPGIEPETKAQPGGAGAGSSGGSQEGNGGAGPAPAAAPPPAQASSDSSGGGAEGGCGDDEPCVVIFSTSDDEGLTGTEGAEHGQGQGKN